METVNTIFAKLSFFDNEKGMATFVVVVLTLVAGGMIVSAPRLGIMIALGIVSLSLIVFRPTWLIYSWLLSSIFYAYRFDVGFITLNPFRLLFIFMVIAIPFLSYVLDSVPARKGQSVLLLSIIALFVVSWVRAISSPRANSEFFHLLFWVGMLVYILHLAITWEQLHKLIKLFLVTSSVAALYSIYQMIGWVMMDVVPSLPYAQYADVGILDTTLRSQVGTAGLPRIASFFNDQNLLAIYLTTGVFFLLAYSMGSRSASSATRNRVSVIVLLLIHILAIFFTFSRSGVLLLLFGLAVFQLKRFRDKRSGSGILMIVISAGIVLFLLGFLFSSTPLGFLQMLGSSILYRFSLSNDLGVSFPLLLTNEQTRIKLISGGFQTFLDFPLWGVGLRNIPYTGSYTAHSFYVTILAKFGIVGALMIGSVLLWPVIRKTLQVIWRSDITPLELALSLSVFTILAFQLVYDNLFSELMILPFAITLIWATMPSLKSNVPSQ